MRALLASALSIAMGCSSQTDKPSNGTITREAWFEALKPSVYLLVVDDASEATQLRQVVVNVMRDSLAYELELRDKWPCRYFFDPGSWHPGDTRILVLHPSAPVGEQVVSPIDDANLAWSTRESSTEQAVGILDAVNRALESRLASAGESHQPLYVFQRAIDLLSRTRAPETPYEGALLGSLPREYNLITLLATTRDDASPGDASNYTVDATALEQAGIIWFPPSVVLPATEPSFECLLASPSAGTVLPAPGRLGDWAGVIQASTVYGWPCDALLGPRPAITLAYLGWVDCAPACTGHEVVVQESGTAKCQITIETPSLDPCPEERGWIDPLGDDGVRRAHIVQSGGQQSRRCEIRQLEGAALQACRTTLLCDGCGSGWCATTVSDLLATGCSAAGAFRVPDPLRFVGGALSNDVRGRVSAICNSQ